MENIKQIKSHILNEYKELNEIMILSEPLIIEYIFTDYIGFLAFNLNYPQNTEWLLLNVKSGKIEHKLGFSEPNMFYTKEMLENESNNYELFDSIREELISTNKLNQEKYDIYIKQLKYEYPIIEKILFDFKEITDDIKRQLFQKIGESGRKTLVEEIDKRINELENKKD